MRNRFFLLFTTFIIFQHSTKSQSQWGLVREDEGIRVFTSEVAGSSLKAFRAEMVIDAELSELVALLKDIDSYGAIYQNIQDPRQIEGSDTTMVYYGITKTPWPVTDRDGIYHLVFRQNYQDKTVTVSVHAAPSRLPEYDGYVRIPRSDGFWEFHPVDSRAVEVTLQMHADPGGSVPGWLTNMFLVDGPLHDFKNIRTLIATGKYKNRKFDFLVDY